MSLLHVGRNRIYAVEPSSAFVAVVVGCMVDAVHMLAHGTGVFHQLATGAASAPAVPRDSLAGGQRRHMHGSQDGGWLLRLDARVWLWRLYIYVLYRRLGSHVLQRRLVHCSLLWAVVWTHMT